MFKDYESVELGRKKSQRKKIKILEDDTNLVIQENMILSEKVNSQLIIDLKTWRRTIKIGRARTKLMQNKRSLQIGN